MAEETLVEQVRLAWAEVLATDTVDRVPLDTNFLEAGGNSLLLVMLWEQLQGLTTRTVKLSDLFQHGTVRAQADLLATDGSGRRELTAIGARERHQLLGRARRNTAAPAGRNTTAGGVEQEGLSSAERN
jgi:aryl carrier-like protein